MPQNFVLHTEIQNGPHSMTYLTCDHTRKWKKKPIVSYKQLEWSLDFNSKFLFLLIRNHTIHSATAIFFINRKSNLNDYSRKRE